MAAMGYLFIGNLPAAFILAFVVSIPGSVSENFAQCISRIYKTHHVEYEGTIGVEFSSNPEGLERKNTEKYLKCIPV